MRRPSKAALKAWETLKKAELGARIATLRAECTEQIKSKRRAAKEGKLCVSAPPKRRRRKAAKKAPPAPRRAAAPKKRPKRRAKKKGRR